jgi:hypothetical protein
VVIVYPVLILQTSRMGYHDVFDAIRKTNFPQHNYLLSDKPSEIERRVVAGEKQLLISGTLRGDWESAKDFVSKMKEKNPQLLTASFSTMGYPGLPFDFEIPSDTGHEKLVEAVRKFLDHRKP